MPVFRPLVRLPVVELARLARTITRWEHEILGWHRTRGLSNGATEAVNLPRLVA